jgi:hypothetical protein
MKVVFQLVVFLFVAISIVMGLLTSLKADREDLAYRQVFNWLISPVIVILGLIFVERKRPYFHRLKRQLFINSKIKF